MKKSQHPVSAATPLHSYLATAKSGNFNGRKLKTEMRVQPPPPSSDMVSKLNDIAKQDPFCYYYKQRDNDPL